MTTKILGHIDCPSCGTVKGMRITPDKNGDPFGFCEVKCRQQLRVGGDRYRVQAFLARFPWANPVTVTGTGPAPTEPAPTAPPPPSPAPPPQAPPKPAPPVRKPWFQPLMAGGSNE